MRVMVTGGLGVNGAWVVRELLDRGHEVGILEARDDTSLIDDVKDRVELVVADVRDAGQVVEATAKLAPEAVVHLAAFVDCDRDPQLAIAVNVGGTANVCAAAVAARVRRVVYTSTKGVYGPSVGDRGHPTYAPIPEHGKRVSRDIYPITKAAAEDVLWWYGRTTELEVAAMRFATIYGPGKLARHGGEGFGRQISLYSSMLELPAAGRPFAVERGADERNDLVYVLDVADAIATVALAPEPLQHNAYNVTGGEPVSTAAYAAAIRRLIPGADLRVGPGLDPMGMGAPYYTRLDGSRMATEFGWQPRYDLERALRDYRDRVAL
ncbi:NAD-dependent epimerase/dehydratase family protein [Pseudonocardia halophobica]|uniref:UDP-glucose 4-epimerase n=1 Tax=Pseudonocardia halophobica TaxID=29401 RepID=A0A9W6NY15_9PSEU|nr:NAD(P)-dependent oxidoreductase [Pseudonocardia halophobica]GLL14005.1 UDP-glucose 4-epimerase [Pseudonocardia halophobica]